jgi:hypothetical protein
VALASKPKCAQNPLDQSDFVRDVINSNRLVSFAKEANCEVDHYENDYDLDHVLNRHFVASQRRFLQCSPVFAQNPFSSMLVEQSHRPGKRNCESLARQGGIVWLRNVFSAIAALFILSSLAFAHWLAPRRTSGSFRAERNHDCLDKPKSNTDPDPLATDP